MIDLSINQWLIGQSVNAWLIVEESQKARVSVLFIVFMLLSEQLFQLLIKNANTIHHVLEFVCYCFQIWVNELLLVSFVTTTHN